VDFRTCNAANPTRACIFVDDHTPSPPKEWTACVPGETWEFISKGGMHVRCIGIEDI
jgi:hypothetical protein